MKDSSVIFLKDWSMLIKSLSNENQLYFWSLFMQYEHNLDIDCDNEFVLPIWNFVKSQLDKMKEKYFEKTVLTNRNNGKLGGRPKKDETQNNPMGLNETQITPKDKDNNKDKDKDKDKDNDLPPTAKPKTFKDFTKEDFHAEIKKFVEQYSKETCRAFFDYWIEPDAKGKMRFQLEKTWATKNRLNMWKSNEGKFGNNSGSKKQILTMY